MKRSALVLPFVLVCLSALGGEHSVKLAHEFKHSEEMNLDWVHYTYLADGFAFVTSHRGGAIHIFKRAAKTGELTFCSSIRLAEELGHKGRHLDAFPVLTADNYLFVTGCWTHAHSNKDALGMNWYRFDREHGTAENLGRLDSDAGRLCAAPGGKSLLLSSPFGKSVQAYTWNPLNGEPKAGARITGEGLGNELAFAPEGHAYSLSGTAIGMMKWSADGTIAYVKSFGMEGMNPKGGIRASTVAVVPDGTQVYAALYGYGEKLPSGKYSGYSALGLLKRDPESGELTFSECLHMDKKMAGINHLVFAADGTHGFYSSGPENSGSCLGWFTRDVATGKLTFGGYAKETSRGCGHVAYAPESGALYASGTWSTKSFWVYSSR